MNPQEELIKQAKAKYKMARIWYSKGKLDVAIQSYQKAIAISPDYLPAYYDLGQIFIRERRFKEAISVYKKGLNINPEVAEIHKTFIHLLIKEKSLNHAFKYYKLVRKNEKKIELKETDILLFSTVKNEELRLPYFLSYYREKGVNKFFIIDNDSNDQTLAYLLEQPDVYTWYSPLSFRQANFGQAWFELLLRKYAVNHWCLIVDADEIFYYPDCESQNIHQLCEILDQHYKKACPAILLDMYSNQKIKDTIYHKGKNFGEVCPYFDKKFYHTIKNDQNQVGYIGGMRQRVFVESEKDDQNSVYYYQSKVPLIKYSLDVTLTGGQHFVSCPSSEISTLRGCLLHFKYFSSFVDYVELEAKRKEHSQNGFEYQLYEQKLRKNPDLNLYDFQESVKLENSQQLIDLSIIKRGETKRNNIPLINKKTDNYKKASHILIYTDCWQIFGAEQWNNALMRALTSQGYQISCSQVKCLNYLIEEREKLGIKHFWLEDDSTYQEHKPPRNFTNTSEPRKVFDLAKPDLIIFSNGNPIANLAAQKVASKRGIPFLQVIHRVSSTEEKLYQDYREHFSFIYQEVRKVIAVSKENLDLLNSLLKLPKNKGKVIYYGRPQIYFEPLNLEVRTKIRSQLNIPLDAVVCFTAARFDSHKGYQYQLNAIASLKKKKIWKKLYFIWAGSGSLLPKLKMQASQLNVTDKIRFLEQRSDVPDLLDAADIFILPSQYEGMPLSIMEAMAKGKPVIATAVSGIPEQLGDTGKIIPAPKVDFQGTIKQLAFTIEKWAKNPQLLSSLGKASRNRAENLFREERMFKEYLNLINN